VGLPIYFDAVSKKNDRKYFLAGMRKTKHRRNDFKSRLAGSATKFE